MFLQLVSFVMILAQRKGLADDLDCSFATEYLIELVCGF